MQTAAQKRAQERYRYRLRCEAAANRLSKQLEDRPDSVNDFEASMVRAEVTRLFQGDHGWGHS
jgi:hypothetical protein